MSLVHLQIRPSDCDIYGHVNNAVYASYFEQTLAQHLAALGFSDDWQPDSPCFWAPQSLTLEYRQAATYGDPLEGRVWLAKLDGVRPAFGFDILRPARFPDHPALALFRAVGSWARYFKNSGEPQEIPTALLARFPNDEGSLPRERRPVSPSSDVRKYSFDHRVQRSEAAPSGHLHLQAFYRLLEESLSNSCEQAGWPVERWLAAGFFTVQTRHDSQILSLPKAGETVRMTSQLVESRRLGGTWQLEMQRGADGQVLARDYSTGVHLNLEGHPASPPVQILKDIQFG
ncbi:MAG: acyl-CoA thioesterase [Anaerolineales bacterium]|jgi:YbgC/YbaW family acyl-CoA thioester hydrolase